MGYGLVWIDDAQFTVRAWDGSLALRTPLVNGAPPKKYYITEKNKIIIGRNHSVNSCSLRPLFTTCTSQPAAYLPCCGFTHKR